MNDIIAYSGPLLKGTLITLELCAISAVAGTVIGMLAGLASTSRIGPLRWLALAYSSVIRGIPVLIILLFTYFALPLLIPGAVLSQLVSGAIGLSLFVSAYVAEIFRGSMLAVPKGQPEAAEALGLRAPAKLRYVVLPQAFRVFVPPWIGTMLGLIKDSSLVSAVGLVDVTLAAKLAGSATMNPLGLFLAAAVIYFIICYPVSRFGRWTEKRLAKGDRADTVNTDFVAPSI